MGVGVPSHHGQRLVVQGRVADDPAATNLLPGQLELGFDKGQDTHVCAEQGKQRREEESERDKRGVYNGQIDGFGDLRRSQMAGITPFKNHYPPILAEFPVEQAVPNVDAVDPRRPKLQQAIRETAGRTANIGAYQTAWINLQGLQAGLKFLASAADVASPWPDRDRCVSWY